MPNIGFFHPQIVHFVIVGAGLGIFFRWVSLTGKFKWTNPAATALIVIGAAAAYFAVRSGTDAHGVTERIPGAVRAVQEHEEEGIDLRNLLLVIGALELAFLVPALAKWRKFGMMATAALGVWGAFEIYETGQAGGELVYSYAGGIGTRSGDTTDVNNLLKAGLYHRAALSRAQKNDAGAAAGYAELAAKFPEDQTAQIMGAESLIIDKKDFAGALTALAKIPMPADTARTYRRYQLAKVDAYIGAGKKDSARMILEPMAAKAPTNKALQDRLEKVK
ncbi:MAG: hypothetical protein NTX19_07650 [Gemmatimonadetes bacterium]|nr:hypothetical protein [Gemmatimonadota bacterium]